MAEVHRAPAEDLERIFRYASIEALLAVANKFELPSEALRALRPNERWFPRSVV